MHELKNSRFDLHRTAPQCPTDKATLQKGLTGLKHSSRDQMGQTRNKFLPQLGKSGEKKKVGRNNREEKNKNTKHQSREQK